MEPATEAKTPRKRRSKRTIARHKKAAADRRAERQATAAERQAKIDLQNKIRWQSSYDAETARQKDRASQRKLQEAGIEWLMGYDTPAARLFEQYVRGEEMAVKVAARRAELAGDPTNRTGHTPAPSKKEQKRQEESERLARGIRYEVIPDPDHPNQNVVVASFRRKKPLEQAHHLPGLEKFWTDIQAVAGAVRSPAFDDKVDRSGMPALLPSALRARSRLDLCEGTIGRVNWLYATGYLLMNMTPTEIHRRGGDQHTTNSARIREALDALCGFYDDAFHHNNRTLEILDKVVKEGMSVIKDGERDLNWPQRQKKKAER